MPAIQAIAPAVAPQSALLPRIIRAAGVTEEDRKALLGHKNGSITSHYSAAELDQLIDAANKVSVTDSRAPALTILKRRQI